MNNFNNIFDNLLPLRPLIPFVQSVLPTVFDDSLSYLETLGKVVKALNDTESNVNTLEQAVRAFADDLAAFENLTIYPVNMTFNENTGNYTADKTFADIDAALLEGRTPILHVVDRDGRNYYSAQLAKSGNTVFYWTTPLFYENGESVIFRAFINSSDVSGVIASPIDSGAVVVNYTTVSGSDIPVVDKTFEQISAALEDNKPVFLFVDSAYWIPLSRANRSGNDVDGYHYVSAEFIYAIPVSTTGGNNLGVGVYSVNTSDVWSVTRYAFPDTGKVNALIEARIASLDGFNSIKKLIYNESTGNVVYYDGVTSTPVTGEEVQINFLSDPKIYVVLDGGETTEGNTVYNLYIPLRYGFVNGVNIGVQFYRVFNGNIEIVTLPPDSSVATKTVTPIGSSAAGAVLYNTAQVLTDQQKAQARVNIDALTNSDLPYVTPEMFGAVGDGVADDSTAFTQMFAFIENTKIVSTRNECPTVILDKVYKVGSFELPNNYYHDLAFIGGKIIGEITFPSKSFYTLQFYGTDFLNDAGFAVILKPNKKVEYKSVSFKSCNFMSKNGVRTDTRSMVLVFDACTFQGCDLAYYGEDLDKLVFKNCWFDTRVNKSASQYPYTIYMNGILESSCVIDSCIIVNATTNMGSFDHTSFVATKGQVNIVNSRLSNEGNTLIYAVEFLENTPDKLSTGHVTGAVIDGCDITTKAVYLKGIPSFINITNCNGNPEGKTLIRMDAELTDVYKTRPNLAISIRDNSFSTFEAVKRYGNSTNASGVNIPAAEVPTIPFELYYAVNRNYQGQNLPLIIPLTNGYKYSVAANTPVNLFKIVRKGTAYTDLHVNTKFFVVKYMYQVPNQSTYISALDIVDVDTNADTTSVASHNIFGAESGVSYSMSVDENEYTITMVSSNRILHGIDFALLDNGFSTI